MRLCAILFVLCAKQRNQASLGNFCLASNWRGRIELFNEKNRIALFALVFEIEQEENAENLSHSTSAESSPDHTCFLTRSRFVHNLQLENGL